MEMTCITVCMQYALRPATLGSLKEWTAIYMYVCTPVFVGTLGSVDVLSSYAVMKSYRQSFMNTGKDNAENRNPAEAECSQGLR